jgi:lysophospholipase L1-like esterase
MNHRLYLYFLLAFIQITTGYSQKISYTWWNPASNQFPVMEGQAWHDLKNPYDRLPAKAESVVRKDVWELSHHGAGLVLRFKSNADQIIVRYKVSGEKAMPHMPATGVSGVDLYAINADGKWLWCAGKYNMSDTIEYRFTGLTPNDTYHQKGREYRLYFPLYNSVQWMEVGVPDGTTFTALPVRKERPIVVYGTSIAQGGCASRPAMAWPAIVGRKLDRPLINLGFSGNGRLEKEVIDLIAEIDASIVVLDCLPNLDASDATKSESVKNRVIESVRQLRKKNPTTPILLAEHCGFSDEGIKSSHERNVKALNEAQREALEQLKSEGHNNLYLLQKEEIALSMDGTVDGIHPNDLGMMDYAAAYERVIRKIVNEPSGEYVTTQPSIQNRDARVYDWDNRHQEILSQNKLNPPRIVFFGNSITHFWGGDPKTSMINGADSWHQLMEPLGVRNFGYGWDRIENVLWRVYHDELFGYEAEQIVILIGTNNISLNSNQEILEGLAFLVEAIKTRQPKAEILLSGIYPRRKDEEKILELNQGIVSVSGMMNVRYLDPGKVLLQEDGKIDETLFTDGLHPNAAGYRKLAEQIIPYLKPVEKIQRNTAGKKRQ